jgi:two-component system, sporulation sensor kinase E
VLETHPDNLNRLVQESISFLANEIKDRDILVELELRSDLPMIEVDADQIKQAFYNIIRNAFQAMQTGGILRIRSDHDDEHVTVSFSDTGGGISQVNMSKLFDPYFTTKKSGSGLGLLVVRRIVREHGGDIAIASDEGKGLTVTVRLPRRDRRVRLLGEGGRSQTDTP